MTRMTNNTKFLWVLAALGLCGVLPAAAQTSVEVTASWTAPTEGSPVHHYVLQLSIDGGAYSTVATVTGGTSQTLDLEIGHIYRARVAGVDSQDRQGPWSQESDAYTPDVGPPGQPGKPLVL